MSRRVACRMVLASLLVPSWAAAVDTSLDDLQRRLDAAKARGTAPATASAPRAPAARRATTATLLVQTDAPCALAIDGKELGPLREAETRQLAVPAGPARIECRSDLDPSARFQLDDRFEGGTRTIVKMTLAAAVETARLRRSTSAASAAAGTQTPRPGATPAASRPAPSASVNAARDDWAAARARLANNGAYSTLAGSLSSLLPFDQPDEFDTLTRFDAMLSSLRWKSAVAVGQRNGYLIFAYSYLQGRSDWAAEQAIGTCERYAERPCQVVMADGRYSRDPLVATAARLGAQPRATVRAALVRDMRTMLERAP